MCISFLYLLVVGSLFACNANADTAPSDLSQVPLEQLMQMNITTVSRGGQKLSRSPAAVFVITREMIRRSGASSIPELLRFAPGIEVARISLTQWAITARGFNGQWANKLLVLVDGRTVYDPTFSGVHWDSQDMLLEDIERIEVIRGPGAVMWGANAVNGVINIITRSSKDTQGGLLQLSAGNQDRGAVGARYGARAGENLYYRAYSKAFRRLHPNQSGGNDKWDALRGGFRADWDASRRDSVTVIGDLFRDNTDRRGINQSARPSGADVLARWERRLSGKSEFALQVYYDRARRSGQDASEKLDTFDVDFQHRFRMANAHELLWGLEGRWTVDEFTNGPNLAFSPAGQSRALKTGFLQDDITLLENRLYLTVGAKLEHNSYTGIELQPGLQVIWTPSATTSYWASVARAVRSPSRVDTGLGADLMETRDPSGLPVMLRLAGQPGMRSETLVAYEAGARAQVARPLSLDVSAYYHAYDRLRTLEPQNPVFERLPRPRLVVPMRVANEMNGNTWGGEVSRPGRRCPAGG